MGIVKVSAVYGLETCRTMDPDGIHIFIIEIKITSII
jgi:hypothetical protein